MSTHSISYPSHKFILIYCASFLYRHICDRQDGTHTGNIHFFSPIVPSRKSRVVTSNGDRSDTQEKRSFIRNTHSRLPLSFPAAVHHIVFLLSHTRSRSYVFQCLLTPSSGSFNPTSVPSKHT